MNQPRLKTLIIFLACFLTGSAAHAQSLATEQAQLATMEKRASELQRQQQQLQQSLQQNQVELKPLLALTSPEQDKLTQAQSALDQAQAVYAAEPSQNNKSKLKNTEFKYVLAERKFKKANSKQFELQEQNKTLSKQLTAANTELASLKANTTQQRNNIAIARSQQQQAEQKWIAEQQRQKTAAAEAEITRLKAKLEQQEKARIAKQTKAAKLATLSEKTTAVTSIPAPMQQQDQTAEKTVIPATPAPATQTADISSSNTTTTIKETVATTSNNTSADGGIFLLTNAEQVQVEELRITALLADKNAGGKSRYNKKFLYVKSVKSSSRPIPSSLKPKGNNIYRSSVLLKKGDTIFTIGTNRWRDTVPMAKSKIRYNVIFDGSTPNKPRFIYYRKSLSI